MRNIVFVFALMMFTISSNATMVTDTQHEKYSFFVSGKCDKLAQDIHEALQEAGASHDEAYETSEGMRILCEVLN